MNYLKLYNQIIERGKTRKLKEYKERHHIIPRCLNGSNDIDNLVDLTAKEHFICHRLLCEIYQNHKGLKYAFWIMCNKKKYNVSSRTYEMAKINHNKFNVGEYNPMYGKDPWNKGKTDVYSQETRDNISKSLTGKKQSQETIDKRIKKGEDHYNFGKNLSVETRNNISEGLKGNIPWNQGKTDIYTEETRNQISETLKNRKQKWLNKNGESKLIPETEISNYLSDGWNFGRK